MSDASLNHPYYPRDLKLPHFIPNENDLIELLSSFFGVLLIALILTWLLSGSKTHLKSRTLVRCKICWFIACGLIHSILEGYFSVFHKSLPGKQSILAQLWKEYGRGDSRYVSGDIFVVCMETITAFVDGPLSFLAGYAFLQNKAYRFPVQLIVSMCQLYGDVLYFSTEFVEGCRHGELWHPLYFWFYFIFMNVVWIIIPLFCIVESYKELTKAQTILDRQTQKKRQ